MSDQGKEPLMTCVKCGGADIRISHRGDPLCTTCAPCPCARCERERALVIERERTLTIERVQEWLTEECRRLEGVRDRHKTRDDYSRELLLSLSRSHYDALAALIVDAATAGRMR